MGIFADVASVVAMAVFLATVNKAILDLIVAPIRRRWPGVDLWWVDYLALLTGLGIGWAFNVNLLEPLQTSETSRIVGVILSGLVIGGGADLINDLFAGVQGRALGVRRNGFAQGDVAPAASRDVAGW